MLKNAILLLVLIGGVFLLEFDHPCRTDVSAKTDFMPAGYTGIWYEIQRSDDDGADCLVHHYTRIGNFSAFDVARDGRFNGVNHRETGQAWVSFPDEEPLRAEFNATVNRVTGLPIQYNYRIVATDYANYAVSWMCTNLPGNRSVEEGAILGRSTEFTETVNNRVDEIVEGIGLNRVDFRYIDHSIETCFG